MLTISIPRTSFCVLYSPNFTLPILFSGLASLRHLLPSLCGLLVNPASNLWATRGEMPRHEIFGHVRRAEFVSPTIHHGVAQAKIFGGRRGGDAAFERGAPGIAFQGAFPASEAPKKIDEENSLRENREENRECNE